MFALRARTMMLCKEYENLIIFSSYTHFPRDPSCNVRLSTNERQTLNPPRSILNSSPDKELSERPISFHLFKWRPGMAPR